MRFALAAILCAFVAAPASAAPQRGRTPATAKPRTAAPQKVRIKSSKRKVRIPARVFRLPKIKALPVAKRDLEQGLKRYRRVRFRIRELRSRAAHLKVTPLAKVESFVVDRLDFKMPRGRGQKKKPKILVVGGVHAGSERVGVESAMRFAEGIESHQDLLQHFDVTVVPLASPSALAVRSRRNRDNVDVNRTFKAGAWSAESKAVAAMMKKEKFDMVLDLHGAGNKRNGFFVIRGANDRGLAKKFVSALPQNQLLDREGAGTTYQIEAKGVVRSSNAGTLKQFGVKTGTPYSYTFEAPARFSGKTQVAGTLKLVFSALEQMKLRTR